MQERDYNRRDRILKYAQIVVAVLILAVVGLGVFLMIQEPNEGVYAADGTSSASDTDSAPVTNTSSATEGASSEPSMTPSSEFTEVGEASTADATETSTETAETSGTATVAVADSPEQRAKDLAKLTENENGVDNAWALFLINAENPLPADFAPNLTSIGAYNGEDRKFDSRASAYVKLMIEAAKNDGVSLTLVSSYRTVERQTDNFRNFYNNLRNKGYSREEAFALTMEQIAVPMTSEHNAGLAIDFNLIEERFDKSAEYKWLRENAHKFGFIFRYPKDAIDITGIIYEPWHFRFVGLYYAKEIRDSGLCLEEYLGDDGSDNDADGVVDAFKREILDGR